MARRGSDRAWRGLWIWGSGGLPPAHHNETIYARRTFELPSDPRTAKLRLSADNRYKLYVNGKFVCRGPARCEPKHQAYDEIDVAGCLKRGKNVLAMVGHHYGESTFQSLERGGWGLLVDGEVVCRGGRRVPVHSDGQWRATRAQAYNRLTGRLSIQLGFQEDFDARKDEPDWTKLRFDDSRWPPARVYGAALTMPFESLEPRGIPFERETVVRFARAGVQLTGRNHREYLRSDNLGLMHADEKRRRAETEVVRDPSAALRTGGPGAVVRPTPPARFHAIVFDFGRETAGFVRLDLEASGGEIIDVLYTEHVRPNGDVVVLPHRDFGMADRYRCRKGRQQHEFFSWKGFRYVLMVFRDVRRPLKLRHVGLRFTSYPVEQRGRFECSDDVLNRIWQTGVYTQQLCMHDAYVDCPWREQAQWWGDARVQWRINCAAFGDRALFARGIKQGAESQMHNGLTYGLFPCEAHSCILPDYTLVWVCSIWDYYWFTGDDAPVRNHFANVTHALGWFERLAGGSHLCGHPGPGLWLFIDWAPLYKADANATFTLQYLEALRAAIRMARHLGQAGSARRWSQQARKVERAVLRAFWDPRRRVFCEGYDRRNRRRYNQVAQHANSCAVLLDLRPQYNEHIAKTVLVRIMRNHDRLLEHNGGGNQHHPKAKSPVASTFFYAYVLEAMFKAGCGRDAINGVRRLWGQMLDDGATTWYESWGHMRGGYGASSACHAWSGSPTYHLSEQVGGIVPAAPGFEKVCIAPKMFDLDYADVEYPTPRGVVRVAWRRVRRRGMDLQVRLPKGVAGRLEVPGAAGRRLGGGKHRFRFEG